MEALSINFGLTSNNLGYKQPRETEEGRWPMGHFVFILCVSSSTQPSKHSSFKTTLTEPQARKNNHTTNFCYF